MGFQNLTPVAARRKRRPSSRLTLARPGGKVRAMRRPALLVSVLLIAGPVGAQRVPGRELLDFPLGALADPPVIASADVALWNPANIIPPRGNRGRIGFASVQPPPDLAISVVGM